MTTIWKHFSNPNNNQKMSVKIEDGEVSVVINDGVTTYYAQKITPPETYATKTKQEKVKKYIQSTEGKNELRRTNTTHDVV